ncbi:MULTISPECIES: LuxR C-terminal-related transcriptional regulator [unclassified Streptomyces]|uniref:LuxR C-terminal-related transcriptional regulator n=1 Tax=unclassified Streptomyces TaxID=2593676 RepID=UPI003324EC4B
MSAALCTEPGAGSRGSAGEVSVLHGRLHLLSGEDPAADSTVTTCLVWVAGTLVRIAGDVGDLRSAGALVGEAAAVLALVPPQPGRTAPPAPQPLTQCQLTVLHQLQQEVPLREIADGLYVSVNTVKSHVRAVYRKLGVSSRAEAVRRARVLGLV